MAPPQVKLDFQILIYPENQWWIAHCLEMDLPAEGKTPEEALRNLYDVSQIQIADAIQRQNLASIFSAAPAELWRQYALGTQKKPRAALPSRFHRVSVREMALIGG